MIDLHAHILPFVDDGSASMESSIEMLKKAKDDGVTDLILTPHFCVGEYDVSVEKIKEIFDELKSKAKENGIDINLYLGQEIFIRKGYKELFKNNKLLTLNDTKYILIEFDTHNDFDIAEAVYELKHMGYNPIVAHFERYTYADAIDAEEIKNLGGLIQVNAEVFVKKTKIKQYKRVKALLKAGLVDFVSSDVHDFRENSLKKAFEIVTKKFGEKTANDLFIENAKLIIKG